MIIAINKKAFYHNFYVICFLGVITLILMMQSPLSIWSGDKISDLDSSVYRTIAFQMVNGLVPYRDSFDHKGPMVYIYNWLGMKINSQMGIWMIEFLSLWITCIIMYKITRLHCGKLYSCLGVFVATTPLYTYFEGGNLTEEYAMPFIALALYIYIDYFLNDRVSTFRLVVCGFALGAVCMLRVNMISVWIVFSLAVLIKLTNQKRKDLIQEFLFKFIGGFLIIIAPIFAWLIKNNAFQDFINDYIVFNSKYVNNGINGTMFNKYHTFTFFLNNTYILLAAVIVIFQTGKKRSIFNIFYCLYFFITLTLVSMSGLKFNHYGMILIPMLIYPFAELLSELERSKQLISFGIMLYILATLSIPSWIDGVDQMIEKYHYSKNTGDSTGIIMDVVDYINVNSVPEDRIIVWGQWNIIYVLSQRLPASKYSYQFPIAYVDDNILSCFYEELQDNKAEIVIIQPGYELGSFETFLSSNHYYLDKEIDGVLLYMLENREESVSYS